MKKKWKFRRRIVNRISPEVKEFIRKLLEPETKKRIVVDEVLKGSWIAMDSRLKCKCDFADVYRILLRQIKCYLKCAVSRLFSFESL